MALADRPDGDRPEEEELPAEGDNVIIEYPSGGTMSMAAEFLFRSHQSIIDGLYEQYVENISPKEPDINITQLRNLAHMFARGFHTQQASYKGIIGDLLLNAGATFTADDIGNTDGGWGTDNTTMQTGFRRNP